MALIFQLACINYKRIFWEKINLCALRSYAFRLHKIQKKKKHLPTQISFKYTFFILSLSFITCSRFSFTSQLYIALRFQTTLLFGMLGINELFIFHSTQIKVIPTTTTKAKRKVFFSSIYPIYSFIWLLRVQLGSLHISSEEKLYFQKITVCTACMRHLWLKCQQRKCLFSLIRNMCGLIFSAIFFFLCLILMSAQRLLVRWRRCNNISLLLIFQLSHI